MEKREGISPIRTPGLWGKDLAIDARQNKLYYTHKLGCWLAAIEERLPRAAKEKGNRWGGLLYRLPVGVWAGMCGVGLLLAVVSELVRTLGRYAPGVSGTLPRRVV
jgi:hypothetical protein